MPILRTIADRIIRRYYRDRVYESRFIRSYYQKHYEISVGLYSSIGFFDPWRMPRGLTVGRYSTIAVSARIIGANHPVGALSTHPYFYLASLGVVEDDLVDASPQVLEDDVWIGHNSIVTPSCARVGRGSIVGAGAVVMEDVPRYAIVVGSPAKLVRYRFSPELIELIEATEWWELDKGELKRLATAAPGFLTGPTLSNVTAFLKAQGREAPDPAPGHVPPTLVDIGVNAQTSERQEILAVLALAVPAFSHARLETPFSELKIDSLGFINLRMAVEQALRRPVSEEDWGRVTVPADLLRLVAADRGAQSGLKEETRSPGMGSSPDTVPGGPAALYWLPELKGGFSVALSAAIEDRTWDGFRRLANHRLDFLETARLSRDLTAALKEGDLQQAPSNVVKLAVLSSSTCQHLLPGLQVGALRRNLRLDVYACEYGQYLQELLDANSGLHAFRPDVILFSLDASHMLSGADLYLDQTAAKAFVELKTSQVAELWQAAQAAFGCQIIQQPLLPIQPTLIGNNEHRLPGSPARLTAQLNQELDEQADQAGADILDFEPHIRRLGLAAWHDPKLWGRSKQEISPTATPLYGDLVARLIAADRGVSSKCLVLDLDNTLWGGTIGDDGVEGLILGQGSADGEAFVAFQRYVQSLSKRGVILAICSKNDEGVALAAFERHPEMVLKRDEIASFVANWDDKATNLRLIAESLNIGLDSIVFADDSPFERNLVRRELPMVSTPELPTEPALHAQCLADAGYFEQKRLTSEDLARASLYQANAQRDTFRSNYSDISSYLISLNMELRWSEFDLVGVSRITQLINKTNQFNLRTRRYTEREVRDVIADPNAIGLQFRLIDQFGDNGVIAVVIGRFVEDHAVLEIDTWLMSCRVLGRQVEVATLEVLARETRRRGCGVIHGEYLPTEKNGIVRDLYKRLGFARRAGDDKREAWTLNLDRYTTPEIFTSILYVGVYEHGQHRGAAE